MKLNELSKKRVVVAMSGGVDSSVAASLLQSQGYEVIGVTIKTWSNDECRDEKSKGCCSIRDIEDARSVARKLNIPYYVLDLSSDFKEKVIDYFVDEYLVGRTPNPCIECNRHIKFGVLLNKADELGAYYVATGHYAKKGFDQEQQKYFVEEAEDANKDQSYVLFGLNQQQLQRTLLPVADLQKPEVRRLAAELGLRVSDKPDSQEICFVKKNYTDFVKGYAPGRLPGAGDFLNKEGKKIGEHPGSHTFTIGQRKRIGILTHLPRFVTKIDSQRNTVTLGEEKELLSSEMQVGRLNWQLTPRLGKIQAKIRSKASKTDAEIISLDGQKARVRFAEAQRAITPGQAAVFYEAGRVIGGGWIL